MFDKVLVPLDGSSYSLRALPYAVAIAEKFNSRIILINVVRPVSPLNSTGSTGTLIASPDTSKILVHQALAEQYKNVDAATAFLEKQIAPIAESGLNIVYRVLVGDPAEAIIDYCRKETIDLVIMTTTGKSGIKRAFLGSVTDRIIRKPGFPVLAIRPEPGLVINNFQISGLR
jgi:nucleotide-binding universal stress UspA family protein